MLIVIWLQGLLGRRGGRLAAAALGITFAVALLAALGSFLGASKATMAQRSIQQVAVDWQVEAQPGANPASIGSVLRSDPTVAATLPVGFAAIPGLTATHGATTLTTGSGMVLGLPPGYQSTFPGEVRYLTGSADGVLIAQQTAANVHASVGDLISIGRPGRTPAQVQVSGIVDLPQADSLFQKIGAVAGAQPKAPPDNVLLLPAAQWHQSFDSLAAQRPDLIKTQLHVKLRHDLPSDPAAAFTTVTAAASNTEARLAGGGLVGDNLGAALGAARQDLYGVRPATVAGATRLQDAYFTGGTARQLISVLARQPDGILVSAETARDFQLNLGDLVRLRLQDGRTGRLIPVPFHYAGIVKEFPTAPRDSFFVANASYVAARTGSPAVGKFLINTDGTSPPVVGARLRAALGPAVGITDILTSRRVIASTLTAVDLSGLTKVELSFALALAISATALLLTLGFVERRRTFALARMLGARPRQLGGFVWSEVLLTGVAGAILGAATGWILSQMLVKVLSGVFDPPPAQLSVPWAYLGVVAALAALGLVIAALAAIRTARRSPLTVLRDL